MKRLQLLIILLSIGLLCSAQIIDRKQLFNFDWKFAIEDSLTSEDLTRINTLNFVDSDWQTVQLPHDWSIGGEILKTNPSGNDGGYFPTGIGWYRKTFHVPAEWQKRITNILFEGVYMNAEVFINGISLGVYPYGYSSFFHDLTPYLHYGRKNIIAVKVDNSKQKNSRWYSGSGIYRHVWIYNTNPIHIDHRGVFVSSYDISSKAAVVEVKTLLKNRTANDATILLNTLIKDDKSARKGSKTNKVSIKANDELTVIQKIRIKNPKLWNPDSPTLYKAVQTISENNDVLDRMSTNFGIRTINFSTDKGFQLNGKTILLNGGCVHHDHGSLGAASFNRAEERKVELLKMAGFNAVRTAHNPFSPAFYEACDRLGLLVINESFDGWRVAKTPFDYALYFDEWWKKDIEAMVLRDRNHPSIIMWSTGNEVLERTEPQAVETANKLAAYVRKLDPTRPVTSALTSWNQGWERFDALFAAHDIAGYNYHIHHAEKDHARVPGRIMVQTESYPKDAFYCWDMVRKHSYIIGDFVWTAMDYLGESGIGAYYYPGEEAVDHWVNDRFPWHGAYCGDIDLTGRRKPVSHYRDMLWNNTGKIYMAVREPNPVDGEIKLTGWALWPTRESWDWPGHENKDIEVEVYSKHNKVRLYLNDKLVAEKINNYDNQFKTLFTLPYQPGVLKATGMNGNTETASVQIETSGQATRLNLKADRNIIKADGLDLSYITVEITDEQNRLNTRANHPLNIAIEGPATLAGIDNANLKDTNPYQSNTRRAHHGRAVVVIRSTREPGDIKVSVEASGIGISETYIKSAK